MSADVAVWITLLSTVLLVIYIFIKANESNAAELRDLWSSELVSLLVFAGVCFALYILHRGVGDETPGLATPTGLKIALWSAGGTMATAASVMLFKIKNVPIYEHMVVRGALVALLLSPIALELITDDGFGAVLNNLDEVPLLEGDPPTSNTTEISVSLTDAEPTSSPDDSPIRGDSLVGVLVRALYHFSIWSIIAIYLGQLWSTRLVQKDRGFDRDSLDRTVMVFAFGVALVLALALAGADFISLGIFAGLLAAGLSLSMREVLNNLAAGLILLWDESVKVSDVIETEDGTTGKITKMTMRYTLVEDREARETLIPNSVLVTGEIRNYSHGSETHGATMVRLGVDYPIPLDFDVDEAIAIAQDACQTVHRVLKHPNNLPRTFLKEYTESAAILDVRFWIDDPQTGIRNVRSDVLRAVTLAFAAQGVPRPHPRYAIEVESPA